MAAMSHGRLLEDTSHMLICSYHLRESRNARRQLNILILNSVRQLSGAWLHTSGEACLLDRLGNVFPTERSRAMQTGSRIYRSTELVILGAGIERSPSRMEPTRSFHLWPVGHDDQPIMVRLDGTIALLNFICGQENILARFANWGFHVQIVAEVATCNLQI